MKKFFRGTDAHRAYRRWVCAFFGILLCVTGGGVFAEEVYHSDELWGFHPPVTWEMLDASPYHTSFADMEGQAVFQVFSFEPGSFADADLLAREVVRRLDAGGDLAGFEYSLPGFLAAAYRGESYEAPAAVPGLESEAGSPAAGRIPAVFGDLSWPAGNLALRGYAVFLPGGDRAFSYAILAFTLEDAFDLYHDFLLSALDSFHPWLEYAQDYSLAPGPVSQFFADPYPLAQLNGRFFTGAGEADSRGEEEVEAMRIRADATQVVIDREARILSQYQEAPAEVQLEAWRRYYQLIYRDCLADMAGVAVRMLECAGAVSSEPEDWPAPILSAFQEYEYRRSGTLADFEAPLTAVLERAGDCDTLVLSFMAVLEHLGIESVVMVSPRHAHSLAGVGSGARSPNPSANARFSFGDRDWLVAELTQDVDLGLIAATMADPADWYGFHLRFDPE